MHIVCIVVSSENNPERLTIFDYQLEQLMNCIVLLKIGKSYGATMFQFVRCLVSHAHASLAGYVR